MPYVCKYFKPKCQGVKFANLTIFFQAQKWVQIFFQAQKNVQNYSTGSQLPNALRFMPLKHLAVEIECILYLDSNVVFLLLHAVYTWAIFWMKRLFMIGTQKAHMARNFWGNFWKISNFLTKFFLCAEWVHIMLSHIGQQLGYL